MPWGETWRVCLVGLAAWASARRRTRLRRRTWLRGSTLSQSGPSAAPTWPKQRWGSWKRWSSPRRAPRRIVSAQPQRRGRRLREWAPICLSGPGCSAGPRSHLLTPPSMRSIRHLAPVSDTGSATLAPVSSTISGSTWFCQRAVQRARPCCARRVGRVPRRGSGRFQRAWPRRCRRCACKWLYADDFVGHCRWALVLAMAAPAGSAWTSGVTTGRLA